MKKLFVSLLTACTLLAAPLFAAASAIDNLFQVTNLTQGACGLPPSSGSSNSWCACFIQTSYDSCRKAASQGKIPNNFCPADNVKRGEDALDSQLKTAGQTTDQTTRYCSKYSALLPAGVDQKECVTDIYFYAHHCPIP